VLDAAGYPPPNGLQGQSLLQPRDSSATVYSEARAFGEYQAANPALRGERHAVYLGNWKLITPTLGGAELYDLAADPAESQNQYHANEPVANSLLGRMNAWTASHPRRPNVKPSKALLERLKSLGYVQGDMQQ